MRSLWFFLGCLLLSGCGDAVKPARPVTMTDKRLIAGLRSCSIDPADAVQVNGDSGNFLVFRIDPPYPEPKMRCLARTLLQANYGVSRSGEAFERAFIRAWQAEFPIYKRDYGIAWLRDHRPGKAPPQFVPGTSLGDFARVLERFCGAKAGAVSVSIPEQALYISYEDEEPGDECLYMAALGSNLEGHGFSVQIPGIGISWNAGPTRTAFVMPRSRAPKVIAWRLA